MSDAIGRRIRITCLTWALAGTCSEGVIGREAAAEDPVWAIPPDELTLDDEDVHVWRVHLALSPRAIMALRRLLSSDELARAGRFRFAADRHRFVAARGALREILARYLNSEADQIRFRYSPHGKPTLGGDSPRGLPARAQTHFSLSHGEDLALVAVARGRRIGVDVERIRSGISQDVIARCFSPRERSELHGLPPAQQTVAFFTCWTRKEAYLKARGEGLTVGLDQFTVSLSPGAPARLLHFEGDPAEASRWTLADLAPGRGWAAALAIEAV
jgi:4'-phosphopantetheinyl transferase